MKTTRAQLARIIRDEVWALREASLLSKTIDAPLQSAIDHVQAAIVELRKIIPRGASQMNHPEIAAGLAELENTKTRLFVYARER